MTFGEYENNIKMNAAQMVMTFLGGAGVVAAGSFLTAPRPPASRRLSLSTGGGGAVTFPTPDGTTGEYKAVTGKSFNVTVTVSSVNTTYDNTLGYYFAGDDGIPISGRILFTSTIPGLSATINYGAAQVPNGTSSLGFFIIPNGGNLNAAIDNLHVTFSDPDELGIYYATSELLLAQIDAAGPCIFTNPSLNPNNNIYSSILDEPSGAIGFMDIYAENGEFDNLILNATFGKYAGTGDEILNVVDELPDPIRVTTYPAPPPVSEAEGIIGQPKYGNLSKSTGSNAIQCKLTTLSGDPIQFLHAARNFIPSGADGSAITYMGDGTNKIEFKPALSDFMNRRPDGKDIPDGPHFYTDGSLMYFAPDNSISTHPQLRHVSEDSSGNIGTSSFHGKVASPVNIYGDASMGHGNIGSMVTIGGDVNCNAYGSIDIGEYTTINGDINVNGKCAIMAYGMIYGSIKSVERTNINIGRGARIVGKIDLLAQSMFTSGWGLSVTGDVDIKAGSKLIVGNNVKINGSIIVGANMIVQIGDDVTIDQTVQFSRIANDPEPSTIHRIEIGASVSISSTTLRIYAPLSIGKLTKITSRAACVLKANIGETCDLRGVGIYIGSAIPNDVVITSNEDFQIPLVIEDNITYGPVASEIFDTEPFARCSVSIGGDGLYVGPENMFLLYKFPGPLASGSNRYGTNNYTMDIQQYGSNQIKLKQNDRFVTITKYSSGKITISMSVTTLRLRDNRYGTIEAGNLTFGRVTTDGVIVTSMYIRLNDTTDVSYRPINYYSGIYPFKSMGYAVSIDISNNLIDKSSLELNVGNNVFIDRVVTLDTDKLKITTGSNVTIGTFSNVYGGFGLTADVGHGVKVKTVLGANAASSTLKIGNGSIVDVCSINGGTFDIGKNCYFGNAGLATTAKGDVTIGNYVMVQAGSTHSGINFSGRKHYTIGYGTVLMLGNDTLGSQVTGDIGERARIESASGLRVGDVGSYSKLYTHSTASTVRGLRSEGVVGESCYIEGSDVHIGGYIGNGAMLTSRIDNGDGTYNYYPIYAREGAYAYVSIECAGLSAKRQILISQTSTAPIDVDKVMFGILTSAEQSSIPYLNNSPYTYGTSGSEKYVTLNGHDLIANNKVMYSIPTSIPSIGYFPIKIDTSGDYVYFDSDGHPNMEIGNSVTNYNNRVVFGTSCFGEGTFHFDNSNNRLLTSFVVRINEFSYYAVLDLTYRVIPPDWDIPIDRYNIYIEDSSTVPNSTTTISSNNVMIDNCKFSGKCIISGSCRLRNVFFDKCHIGEETLIESKTSLNNDNPSDTSHTGHNNYFGGTTNRIISNCMINAGGLIKVSGGAYNYVPTSGTFDAINDITMTNIYIDDYSTATITGTSINMTDVDIYASSTATITGTSINMTDVDIYGSTATITGTSINMNTVWIEYSTATITGTSINMNTVQTDHSTATIDASASINMTNVDLYYGSTATIDAGTSINMTNVTIYNGITVKAITTGKIVSTNANTISIMSDININITSDFDFNI